eukprot:TRINITY_DN3627_c0_g1_i1.p1 TRINITY_DN3627_c0_g1~~TRINITY_DN3627_c0_g1_i1.p1  ORF type:complete len:288 (+),score=78.12 TRINITY_DN3627_c0_g1_i1:205-1068(+)
MDPDVQSICEGLVKEFLKKKGLKATASAFEAETKLNGAEVMTWPRGQLAGRLKLGRVVKHNREKELPLETMLEIVVEHIAARSAAPLSKTSHAAADADLLASSDSGRSEAAEPVQAAASTTARHTPPPSPRPSPLASPVSAGRDRAAAAAAVAVPSSSSSWSEQQQQARAARSVLRRPKTTADKTPVALPGGYDKLADDDADYTFVRLDSHEVAVQRPGGRGASAPERERTRERQPTRARAGTIPKLPTLAGSSSIYSPRSAASASSPDPNLKWVPTFRLSTRDYRQ